MDLNKEYEIARSRIYRMYDEFVFNNPWMKDVKTVIHISDDEELQSVMMWVCVNEGRPYARTKKETHFKVSK